MTKEVTDLEFVQQPDLWPRWPVLPMVNKNAGFGDRDFSGYLFNQSLRGPHTEPVVRIGNIMSASEEDEQRSYDTFEDLLKEWKID